MTSADDDSRSSASSPEAAVRDTSSAPVDSFPYTDFPEARVVTPRHRSLSRFITPMWLIALLCAVATIVLLYQAVSEPQKRITISFRDGYGIEAGDKLRLRGIDVGEIESAVLQSDLQRVLLTVT